MKGYVRKGGSLEAQKEYTRAADAYKKAFEIDPNNKEATDGYKRCVSVSFWRYFLYTLFNNQPDNYEIIISF